MSKYRKWRLSGKYITESIYMGTASDCSIFPSNEGARAVQISSGESMWPTILEILGLIFSPAKGEGDKNHPKSSILCP